MSAETIVWHVLYDVDGPGDYDTGQRTYRTRNAKDAAQFAEGRQCWGAPAHADPLPVSRQVIKRWERTGMIN